MNKNLRSKAFFLSLVAFEIYWQVGTAWNRLTLHALPLLLIGGVIQGQHARRGEMKQCFI